MIFKVSWQFEGEVPAATYIPFAEDACHFWVESTTSGLRYKVPHRNVYIMGFDGEPQEHKAKISEYITLTQTF